MIKELLNLLEEKWVSSVKTKKHPPDGLFSNGTVQEIADWAWYEHHSNKKKAMASLNFFINRNSNISGEIIDKIEKAKDILRKKWNIIYD